MSYDSHLKFAKDLLDFCKKLAESSLNTNSNIVARMVYARLYYALFHKALNDNQNTQPFNGKSANLHSYIKDNLTELNIKKQYKIFYELRQWADYEITQCPLPEQKLNNYIALCEDLFNKTLQCQSLAKK